MVIGVQTASFLDSVIRNNPTLAEQFARDFVMVKVTVDQENDNEEFLSQYPDFEWVPHFYIINDEGEMALSLDTRDLMSDGQFDEAKLLSFLAEWAPVHDASSAELNYLVGRL